MMNKLGITFPFWVNYIVVHKQTTHAENKRIGQGMH